MVANLVVFEVRKRTRRAWSYRHLGEHGWIGDDLIATYSTYTEASAHVATLPPTFDERTGLSVEYCVFHRQLIGEEADEYLRKQAWKAASDNADDMPRNVKIVRPY